MSKSATIRATVDPQLIEVRVPNDETQKVIDDSRKGSNVTTHNSLDGYFNKIESELAENPDLVPLSDDQKRLLDNRLDAYYQNPEVGQSWRTVKEKLRSNK